MLFSNCYHLLTYPAGRLYTYCGYMLLFMATGQLVLKKRGKLRLLISIYPNKKHRDDWKKIRNIYYLRVDVTYLFDSTGLPMTARSGSRMSHTILEAG